MKKFSKPATFIIAIITLMCLWIIPANAAVVPAAPKGLEAESYYADSIDLYWDEASLADGYRVFVRENGKWKTLAEVEEGYYEVENLIASTKYTFAVRSFRIAEDDTYTWSSKYATVTAKTERMEDKPILKAIPGTTSVELKWTKVAGASGYRVYIRENKKWVKVKDVSNKNLSYTVTGLEGETAYSFTIKPYARATSGVQWGSVAKTAKATTKDPTQVQLKATANESSITLSWDKVPGAKGYRVYIRENNKWKSLKTLSGTSYTVTGLNSDTYYTFCAKAYKKVDGATKWFPLSSSFKYATEPTADNLTAYRIEKYDKIFEGNFLLETMTYDDYSGEEKSLMAVRNGYLYTEDTLFGLIEGGVKIITNPKTQKVYMIFDKYKAYYTEKLDYYDMGDADDLDYFTNAAGFPIGKSRGAISVSVVDFEGKKVICESFKDTDKRLYKFYFQADTLIAYDIDYAEYMEEESSEDTITRTYVTKFSKSVPSSYFAVPKGYKRVSADEFLGLVL